MKHIILVAAFASVLGGCAAMDTLPGASGTASDGPVEERVDAVTRRPAQVAPQPAEPAPAPEPAPKQADVAAHPVPVAGGSAVIDPSLDPSTARSYNATWEDGGFRHRSVMFPHVIDGCKVMIQSRRTLDYVAGTSGEFFEREGPDCNCDLVIDGFEDIFAQLNDEYKTPRMYEVCVGPGVDGATRQLEIMRETLKEDRNFDKMKNVEGF